MTTQPGCFGKSWDPNHVECTGGPDKIYQHPTNGTHFRDKCSWFDRCGQQMNRPATYTVPSTSTLIPATSLTQPRPVPDPPRPPLIPNYPPPTPTPPFTPPRPPATPVQYSPQTQQQPAPLYHPYPQAMVPPHVAQQGPQYVYSPYQIPGTQSAQFLTVPEPIREDTSMLTRFFHEVLRACAKGAATQVAAFIDSNPFRRHRQ